MTTEAMIQKFMQEFRASYMVASDYLFANNDDYELAAKYFKADNQEIYA